MPSEQLQQLKDELLQELSERLTNSTFDKILEKYGISGDDILNIQCNLDLTKIQVSETDESQQAGGMKLASLDEDLITIECMWCACCGCC